MHMVNTKEMHATCAFSRAGTESQMRMGGLTRTDATHLQRHRDST
jgi:hypothetical protein